MQAARRNSTRDDERAPGHFRRLGEAEEREDGRRDVGEDAAFAAALGGVGGDVDEVDEVGGVRGIWRTVGVPHLLAVAVVGGEEQAAAERERFLHDQQ